MSNQSMPYIGSKIALISNSEIRYEGILYAINAEESTVALQDVRSHGTENRRAIPIPPSEEVYDFIIFRGKDIKDLTVCEPAKSAVPNDPAIVSVNQAPPPDPNSNKRMQGGNNYMTQPDNQFFERPMQSNYMRSGPVPYNNRGYAPRRGGYYGRGRPNGGRRVVVGELPAQLNNSMKTQLSEAFDFEESNSKFDKGTLTKPEQEDTENPVVVPTAGYDKDNSFFDTISCETLERQAGNEIKVDREKQRAMDTETFGDSANINRGPRFRRGYGRGGFRGRGRDGGYGGYGYSYGGGYLYPRSYGGPRY